MFAAKINYITGAYSNWRRMISLRMMSLREVIGANRSYRMQLVKKPVFYRWLRDKADRLGHDKASTLFGEPAVQQFLRNHGFKNVQLDNDLSSFTCDLTIGWFRIPGKRTRLYLPRWCIVFSELEILAQKKSGNASFGDRLSLFDSMNVYDDHITRGIIEI